MSASVNKLENCEQGRKDCFAYTSHGMCTALEDCKFDKPCPFYKTKEVYERENPKKKRKK